MSKRVALITCADHYMGPANKRKFEATGIAVVTGHFPMTEQSDVQALVESAGHIDILMANLAQPPMTCPVQDITNSDWKILFDK